MDTALGHSGGAGSIEHEPDVVSLEHGGLEFGRTCFQHLLKDHISCSLDLSRVTADNDYFGAVLEVGLGLLNRRHERGVYYKELHLGIVGHESNLFPGPQG